MKIKDLFIPKSSLVRYSILGIVLFVILFFLGRSIVIVKGPFERPSFFNDPIPAAITIIAALFGVSSLFTGLIAIIKKKDRAIPIFISTLLGLFILVFWLGEILSPH